MEIIFGLVAVIYPHMPSIHDMDDISHLEFDEFILDLISPWASIDMGILFEIPDLLLPDSEVSCLMLLSKQRTDPLSLSSHGRIFCIRSLPFLEMDQKHSGDLIMRMDFDLAFEHRSDEIFIDIGIIHIIIISDPLINFLPDPSIPFQILFHSHILKRFGNPGKRRKDSSYLTPKLSLARQEVRKLFSPFFIIFLDAVLEFGNAVLEEAHDIVDAESADSRRRLLFLSLYISGYGIDLLLTFRLELLF